MIPVGAHRALVAVPLIAGSQQLPWALTLLLNASVPSASVTINATAATVEVVPCTIEASVSASVSPGNCSSGNPSYTLTLQLSEASSFDTLVAFSTSGSAVSGVDYVPLEGVVSIAAGQTSSLLTVVPVTGLNRTRSLIVTLRSTSAASVIVGSPSSAVLDLVSCPAVPLAGGALAAPSHVSLGDCQPQLYEPCDASAVQPCCDPAATCARHTRACGTEASVYFLCVPPPVFMR